MAYKVFETTSHDYDPVNKYIDEKARLRRTKSTWRNTKSLALFLLALGVFLILAAYAYHIFKKPHERLLSNNEVIKSEEKNKFSIYFCHAKKSTDICVVGFGNTNFYFFLVTKTKLTHLKKKFLNVQGKGYFEKKRPLDQT